jgi:hypothetical protein
MRRWLAPVALAMPGLVLAVAGFFHPMHLGYATSRTWWLLHVAGLFVFPLVGVALAWLFRGRRDPVALLAVLAAYVYATAYTTLDVVNGIAAGYVTYRVGPGQPRPDEVGYLFDLGRPFGVYGSWALVLATVVVALDALRRLGLRGLPALVMVPGAYLVHDFHIFAPQGVAGMALIGLATGWLAYCASGRTSTTAARSTGP